MGSVLCTIAVILILPVEAWAQSPQSDHSAPTAQVDENERVHASLAEIAQDLAILKKRSVVREWTPAGAALLTSFVAIVALIANVRMVGKTIAEKAREEERNAIRAKINDFYGPFLQLRNASRFLYQQAFIPRRTDEERAKYADSEGHFRTLIALIRGHQFAGTDAVILEQIVDIGRRSSELIASSIGVVDDPELREDLARATSHFRLIQLALQRPADFSDAGSEFDGLTFPSTLDSQIQSKLNALNNRLDELTRSK